MVDHRVGSATLGIKLKISENDVLEDHNKQVPEDNVMENGAEEGEEVQIQKNNDDNRRRICHVCSKGFSSGKALGGHMRIHVQAAKKQLLSGKKGKRLKSSLVARYYKKRILQQEELDLENYNNQLLPTCSICGKNFPSMKSLFGHMRCHPERAWRGIQPPIDRKTASGGDLSKRVPGWSVTTSEEIDRKTAATTASGEDLSKRVPGWSVTAKRGRKASAEATNSGPKDEEKLHDAVHHLMLLANGDSVLESGLTGSGYNKHGIPEELEITNSNSLTSKAETDPELAYHVSESMNNKKTRKKMKLKFLDSVKDAANQISVHDQNTPEKYKCNTCGKSFATHQALGGHKSSHNKFRMAIQNSDVSNAATSEEAAASSSKLLADSKLCYSNKNFTTNRCQWGSPIIDLHQTGPSSSQLTSPGEFSRTTGPRILNFDLNELPPDHEDHEPSGDHEYFHFFQFN